MSTNKGAPVVVVVVVVVKILGPQYHLQCSILRETYPYYQHACHYEKGSDEELIQATKPGK